jgi:hypothetical protein
MTTILLRPVDDDGRLGGAVGTASDENETDIIEYEGSIVVRQVVEAVAFRFKIDEREALRRLAADGWSNGKLALGEG